MPLRSADAYGYAKFRSTLAETDCNALFSTGKILPVLIRDGGTELFVELDNYTFANPEQLPGFQRFELRPDERARREEEAERQATEAAKPKTYAELLRWNEEAHRRARAERYQQNRELQGIEADPLLAGAAQHEREKVAAGLRPQR